MSKQREPSAPAPRRTADVIWRELPREERVEAAKHFWESEYAPKQARDFATELVTELPPPLALQLAELLGQEIAALARAELAGEPQLARPPTMNRELVIWPTVMECPPSQRHRARPRSRHDRKGVSRPRPPRSGSLPPARADDRSALPRHRRRPARTPAREIWKIRGKPWRDSTNAERLDGQNGLLLTPSMDHQFDRGFIAFKEDGRLLVSPVAHKPSLERMGVVTGRVFEVGRFTTEQGRFLEYHRDEVFLSARVRNAG